MSVLAFRTVPCCDSISPVHGPTASGAVQIRGHLDSLGTVETQTGYGEKPLNIFLYHFFLLRGTTSSVHRQRRSLVCHYHPFGLLKVAFQPSVSSAIGRSLSICREALPHPESLHPELSPRLRFVSCLALATQNQSPGCRREGRDL